MRTNLPKKLPKGLLTMLFAALLASATMLSSGCSDDEDFTRAEHILWSTTPDFVENEETRINCPVAGMTDGVIYINSNVEYKVVFEAEQEEGKEPIEWIHILDKQHDQATGLDKLIIAIDPHPGTYKIRKGCISLISSTEYLNNFIPIVQGFVPRVEGDFSWLKYGSTNPMETKGEVLIANWAEKQSSIGWQSTKYKHNGAAYCYGKNNYIKLGDDAGHGADLITPYTPSIRYDTAMMLRFNAIAYKTLEDVKDNNKLIVNILGGGQFLDGTTQKTLTLNYLDPAAATPEVAMWEQSQQTFYLLSHPKHPFTGDTRIQLVAGEAKASENSRIFVDNFYVFALRWYDYDLFGGLPWPTDDDEKPKKPF